MSTVGRGKKKEKPDPPVLPEEMSTSSNKADTLSIMSETLSDVPSDIIIRSRIKYGSRWSACKGVMMEYCANSNIHGIRYLSEVHRPFYEKVFWIVVLVTSVYYASSLIWDTYVRWQDSPVILGFDETLVPVHKIPFPTITICPEIKMDRNTFDFTNTSREILEEIEKYKAFKNYGNFTEDEIHNFIASLHVCDRDVVDRFAPFMPKNAMPDVANTLVGLSVSKNETSPFCKWNGRFYFCDKLINYVATDEGICYQFNGLQSKDIYRDPRFVSYSDPEIVDFNNYYDPNLPRLNNYSGNWSLDDGFVKQGYNSYPQRTVFSSARNAFYAFLQGFKHNLDYTCRSFKQGYKVFLNSPESVPLTEGNYILVPHGDEVMVSVLPQYVMSTENLHDFKPEKRQCYFNDERYLRFFQFYSQNNCQTECLTNFTIQKCGCVKFWMPKPLDVPVCGVTDISCYSDAQRDLSLLLQSQTMQRTVDRNVKIRCDCMPSCNSLDYNFEISSARYDLAKLLVAFREDYEHPDFLGSRLSVYFKERQFTAIKRTVLFNLTTLIANWGGIFGLFMGISIVSIIELVYFFSIRLFDNLHKRRIIKKKIMQNEAEHVNE